MRILPATLSLSLSKFRQFLAAEWGTVAVLYALCSLPAVVWRLADLLVPNADVAGYASRSLLGSLSALPGLALGLLSMIGDLALLALASAWLSDRESGFLKSLRGAWSLLGTYIGIMIAWGLLFLPLLLIPFVIRRLAAASLDRNELNRLQGIVVGTVSQLLSFFSGPLMVERGQTFFQNVFRSLKMFIKHASLVVVLAALPIVLYLSVFLFDRESAPTLYGFLFLLSNAASFLMHALRLCAFRQVSAGSEPA